jgi:hypothetical protein
MRCLSIDWTMFVLISLRRDPTHLNPEVCQRRSERLVKQPYYTPNFPFLLGGRGNLSLFGSQCFGPGGWVLLGV